MDLVDEPKCFIRVPRSPLGVVPYARVLDPQLCGQHLPHRSATRLSGVNAAIQQPQSHRVHHLHVRQVHWDSDAPNALAVSRP